MELLGLPSEVLEEKIKKRLGKRIKRLEKNLVYGETRKSAKALTKRQKNF